MTAHSAATLAVFVLTYALIASRRLRWLPIGRPAGALLGAVLMVAIGALTPEQSYKAVDHDTIVLLLGMMLLAAYLEVAGFFEWASDLVLSHCRGPRTLLAGVALVAAPLSALLVNDTVCLFLTPLVVTTCLRAGLPFTPYLLALATSSNIGSAATLVGNPQNMLIGSMSQLPFATFLLCSLPAVLVGLSLNIGLLALYYRRALPAAFASAAPSGAKVDARRLRLCLYATTGVVVGFFAGGHLGYTALAGAVALMLLYREEPGAIFARVDWTLLVFFSGLFVVVGGLRQTGLVDAAWALLAPSMRLDDPGGVLAFSAAMTLGSNTVSNVPLVLLLGPYLHELGADPTLAWVLLSFVTTVAGNLTLVGSVANIIVAEGARAHHTLGFLEYLRFGSVSTLLVLAAGVPLLCWWVPLVS